jgi:signal transduction histidine kinase
LNVSDLVAETVQLLRSSVSKKAVIQTNPAPGLPAIWANATQVRQLVMNLLTNASEALGDRPGSITFTTTHVIPADGDSIKKGHVLLEVSDTGCGIREEIQHKVFDPFFTTKAQGRGLGLSAVYGIARGFGGSVRVRSVPGQGSTFEVLFPCSRKEP